MDRCFAYTALNFSRPPQKHPLVFGPRHQFPLGFLAFPLFLGG